MALLDISQNTEIGLEKYTFHSVWRRPDSEKWKLVQVLIDSFNIDFEDLSDIVDSRYCPSHNFEDLSGSINFEDLNDSWQSDIVQVFNIWQFDMIPV